MDVAPLCQRLHEINWNSSVIVQKIANILIYNSIKMLI
jgi:hypothetical protein